ncbi:MAG: hypothetical protein ACK4ST_06240, partial [Elioraea tepidiphila]
ALALAETAWAWRLVLIVGFLLATLPVASNLLARAAVRESALEDAADRAARAMSANRRSASATTRGVTTFIAPA